MTDRGLGAEQVAVATSSHRAMSANASPDTGLFPWRRSRLLRSRSAVYSIDPPAPATPHLG